MAHSSAADNPEKYLKKQGWLSVVVNLLLFVVKYWAGVSSHSLALIADAWHTLSDSFSSVIVLITARISKIPADKEHPFGHGRADLIAALIIGVILGVIGFNFLSEGIQRLVAHEAITYKKSAIVVTVISILLKEGLAQYAFWARRKSGFETLHADGWHHRSDAISSVVVLVGIFVNPYFWWVDSVLSIVVSLLIFQATYEIMKRAISPLMGERPTEALKQEIRELCEEVASRDLQAHHFHIHKYGRHTELTFHIVLDGEMNIRNAHEICEKIEWKVKERFGYEATIHYDPK